MSWSQEHESVALTLVSVVGLLDRAASLAFDEADRHGHDSSTPALPSPWYSVGTGLYLASVQARSLVDPAALERGPGATGDDVVGLLRDADELLADVDPAAVPGVSQLVVTVCDLLHEVSS